MINKAKSFVICELLDQDSGFRSHDFIFADF